MPPLLERGPFLDQLARLLQEAEAGRGRFVLVGGEAGVGKTGLVQSFSQSVTDQARILTGACDPLSTPTALGPLLDIAEAVGDPLAHLLESGAPRPRVFDTVRAALNA